MISVIEIRHLWYQFISIMRIHGLTWWDYLMSFLRFVTQRAIKSCMISGVIFLMGGGAASIVWRHVTGKKISVIKIWQYRSCLIFVMVIRITEKMVFVFKTAFNGKFREPFLKKSMVYKYFTVFNVNITTYMYEPFQIQNESAFIEHFQRITIEENILVLRHFYIGVNIHVCRWLVTARNHRTWRNAW